jgi:hypothetical protein
MRLQHGEGRAASRLVSGERGAHAHRAMDQEVFEPFSVTFHRNGRIHGCIIVRTAWR